MEIKKNLQDHILTVALTGRLDSNTAAQLENELEDPNGFDVLIFDFAQLEFLSSAGLRVMILAQKELNKAGKDMIIRNASEEIKDIFEVTGLTDLMNIE